MPPPRLRTSVVLLRLLEHGAATRRALAAGTGMSPASVGRAIEELHVSLEPRVHIEGWQTGATTAKNPKARLEQRRYAPIYAYGPGLDALKPAPLTKQERNRRYKARAANRATINAGERRRHWRVRAARRDKLTSALFGPPVLAAAPELES